VSTLVEELRDRRNFVAQGPAYLIKKCEQAADEITRLQGERDEANDRIEELEDHQEILAVDFEKDCWKAMRSLLMLVGFDDFSEGVSAEDAREVIAEAFENCSSEGARWKARAEAAEAEVERLKSGVDDLVRAASDEATENARLREALSIADAMCKNATCVVADYHGGEIGDQYIRHSMLRLSRDVTAYWTARPTGDLTNG
jgi:hypothetical protein